MSKLKTAFAFIFGAAVGGAGVWYYINEKYIKCSEQEILSIKESYHNHEKALEERIKELEEQLEGLDENPETPDPTVLVAGKVEDKEDVVEFARGRKYTQYTPSPVEKNNEQADIDAKEAADKLAKIARESAYTADETYVISPDEFGEEDDYAQVSLTYYADGILADENGVIIDDVEEIVGDALDHFGEYEDDSVFCRNDPKRCDYEILRDLRRYADVRRSFPPNI